jgi:hypothetical protein
MCNILYDFDALLGQVIRPLVKRQRPTFLPLFDFNQPPQVEGGYINQLHWSLVDNSSSTHSKCNYSSNLNWMKCELDRPPLYLIVV